MVTRMSTIKRLRVQVLAFLHNNRPVAIRSYNKIPSGALQTHQIVVSRLRPLQFTWCETMTSQCTSLFWEYNENIHSEQPRWVASPCYVSSDGCLDVEWGDSITVAFQLGKSSALSLLWEMCLGWFEVLDIFDSLM